MRREPTNIGPHHSCCAGYLQNSSTNSQLEPWAPWNLLTVPWPLIRRITARHALPLDSLFMSSSENEGPTMLSGANKRLLGIKSDSATSSDCAIRIAQVCGRIAQSQLGLRNSQDCATPLAQLSTDCATPRIAQLFGRIAQLGLLNWLRNLACATPRIAQTFGRIAQRIAQLPLRNSQNCATLWSDSRWLYQNCHGTSNWLGVSTWS